MKRILRYAELYLHFFSQNLKARMEYRVDFLIGVMATTLVQLTGLAFIGIVFSKVPHVRGWTVNEVALIYGLAGAGRGLTEFLFDNVWYMSWLYVREGRFDNILRRPLPPLFHFIADRVETHGLGNLGMGLAIALVAWSRLGLAFTPAKILFLVVVIVSGALIHFAINLAVSSISFWLIDLRNLLSTIDQFSYLAKYPISIYPQALQTLVTWILPYAFVGFYPATVIMGRGEYVALGLAAPLVAFVGVALATVVFHRGLLRYESTGT